MKACEIVRLIIITVVYFGLCYKWGDWKNGKLLSYYPYKGSSFNLSLNKRIYSNEPGCYQAFFIIGAKGTQH